MTTFYTIDHITKYQSKVTQYENIEDIGEEEFFTKEEVKEMGLYSYSGIHERINNIRDELNRAISEIRSGTKKSAKIDPELVDFLQRYGNRTGMSYYGIDLKKGEIIRRSKDKITIIMECDKTPTKVSKRHGRDILNLCQHILNAKVGIDDNSWNPPINVKSKYENVTTSILTGIKNLISWVDIQNYVVNNGKTHYELDLIKQVYDNPSIIEK